MRIPDGSSIFEEAKAIDLALYLIAECETSNKFVTFSDAEMAMSWVCHLKTLGL